jgi:hypothetical protein
VDNEMLKRYLNGMIRQSHGVFLSSRLGVALQRWTFCFCLLYAVMLLDTLIS